MDADSSYGGSDTAQDYHSTHENNSSFETSHTDTSHDHDQDKVTTTSVLSTQQPAEEINNQFYHINEVTLPINYNENGYQSDENISQPREPHYLSTANLNINETLEHHSNLEEMNKQYKSTSHLNSESPRGMKRTNSGIDNPVFENDVTDQTNVKSTFDNTKPYNGELHQSLALGINSPNHNEEPMTEAVNLELINLKPVGKDVTGHYENVGNGMTTIPLKRENDAEVGNPYDEYFVPVNEHRKYMRGEKLYVTMDKRGKKSKSKCLCWGICLCIVAAALIIGILAAVGVIGNQEPLQEVSARNFDGTEPEVKKGSLFSSGKISNIEPLKPEHLTTPIYDMLPSTEMPIIQVGVTEKQESQEIKGRRLDETEPQVYEDTLFTSSKISSTEPATPYTPAPSMSTISNIPPSTEMSMIQVPRALDSEIVIDNIQFTPALANRNSSEFNALSTELGKELMEALFSKDILRYGPADIKVTVKEFTPERTGNVIVDYRIVWEFNNGIHNHKDPINKLTLEKRMSQLIEQNNGLIGPYHVMETPVKAERILDLCKIDNNGCEHICLFDYNISDFSCICPHGKILSKDKKMCVDELKYHTESNVGLVSNLNDEQDHYSKYEPNFETITTTQSSQFADSEFDKKSKYNVHSVLYSDISPQTQTTLIPESVTSIPSSVGQDLAQDTEKYVTESISDLGEQADDAATHLNTEYNSSINNKFNEYSNPEIIMQTTTEYSSERDTTTIVPKITQELTYPFELTTVFNNMKGNKGSERLTVTTSPTAETTLDTNNESRTVSTSILKALVEITTQLSTEPTTEHTTETDLEGTSESAENSSKKLIEEQNDITEGIFIQTTTNSATRSGDNESYTMLEITTDPNIFSEDKMHELGFVKVVTPEAEVYATTDSTLAYEYADSNRIRKTSNEESKTAQSLNSINNEMSTKSQPIMEITTQMLSQTGENELYSMPVIINEDEKNNKTESLPGITYVSTEMPSSYTKSVPVNVSEHYETNNQSPKIYEITTEQVVSEIKKNIENSTEKFSEQINAVEHQEYSPNDYMSPFLPEIENDTFANTLHSDDHFNDNLYISKHVDSHENITEYKTNPPNLENDQMNHTNPLDPQQNDTYLGVVPLQRENKENVLKEQNHTQENIPTLQKEIYNPDNITEIITEDVTNSDHLNDSSLTESNLESTTVGNEYYKEQNLAMLAAKENDRFVSEPVTLSVTETILEPFETTTMEEERTSNVIKEKYMVTTLPPEIINNVHSNNYFENNSKLLEKEIMLLNEKNTKEQELTTQTLTEITTTQTPLGVGTEYPKITIDNENNKTDDSSTEDLIASETTTNRLKSNDENQTQDMTSESNYLIENSTINGEIINTVTELVNIVTTEENDMSTEELTTSGPQLSPSTFQSILLDPINHYEVKETFADITTTEKLFLSTKPTTNIVAIVNNEDNEDLSIIPLEREVVDNTKLDKKRLANEDNFNQLEQLDSNSFNSISNEDHNLNNFPEEFNSKYIGDLPQNENITNSEYSNKSSKGLEIERQKLGQYNKAIFNKTIKQDILVLKDDNENLNTVKQEGKVKTNYFDTVKPVTEDFTLPRFTRCVVNQFPCLNGTSIKDGSYCIPSNDRCDSVHDCTDGSDEVNCTEEGCPNNFQCSSGQCLKRYLVCDGIINCNDGSDEVNCDKWTCNFDEISCGPGNQCIPISWKCDGRTHCSDGSDELHCHQYSCSNDTFHCTEQDTCIPLSWKCDGKSDCADGDDEKLCECTQEQFKCNIGGGCIKIEEVCDGIEQCADKSDEWNCLRLEKLENNSEETSHKNILQVQFKNNTWYPVCMDWSNWNTTIADKICQTMGFAGATLLESIPNTKGNLTESYYKLITPSSTMFAQTILSQLKKTEHGGCDQFVSISCQEFVCGATRGSGVPSDQIEVNGNKILSSLGLLYDIKHNMYCTATILTPLWAVTSYSCMIAATPSVEASEWTLSAGGANFNQTEKSSSQTRQIERIVPHPQAKFSNFEYINDVVLIRLSHPLILNENISTVCLASKDRVPEESCITAGWKFSKPGEHFKQQYIHHISGPTINSEECNSTKHYNGMITEDKICAAYNNTPCYNDEGAPLMCSLNANGTWELQGIQSHQENCGGSTHPTIYSAISLQLKSWITNTIGKMAFIRNL